MCARVGSEVAVGKLEVVVRVTTARVATRADVYVVTSARVGAETARM